MHSSSFERKLERSEDGHFGHWAERGVIYLKYMVHPGNLFPILQWLRFSMPVARHSPSKHVSRACRDSRLQVDPANSRVRNTQKFCRGQSEAALISKPRLLLSTYVKIQSWLYCLYVNAA